MSGLEFLAFGLPEAIGLAGTAVSAGGALMAADAQSSALKAEAAAAERRASEERAIAQKKAEDERKKAAALKSQQQAAYAASGGGIEAGDSATEVMAETGKQGEYNAELQLWQGEEAAKGQEFSAAAKRAAASSAKTAGFVNAGSTILSGVSSTIKRNPSTSQRQSSYRYG
jgi:hypothetical protein